MFMSLHIYPLFTRLHLPLNFVFLVICVVMSSQLTKGCQIIVFLILLWMMFICLPYRIAIFDFSLLQDQQASYDFNGRRKNPLPRYDFANTNGYVSLSDSICKNISKIFPHSTEHKCYLNTKWNSKYICLIS